MPNSNYTLYLVMGPDVDDPAALARAAAAGGVSIIQWRDKTGSAAEQVEAVRALVAASPVPVLVNDRADVAVAAGAAGVHVGHGDLTAHEARAVVGPDAIVGLTIHTLEEAAAADGAPIDYSSVGGVFETTSKHNPHPPIGIDGFKALSEKLRQGAAHPVIAVAGITPQRAETLAAAGADGVAVMSAITKAPDPAEAARTLLTAFQKGAA